MTNETPPVLQNFKLQLHAAVERDLARGTSVQRLKQRMLSLSVAIVTATATVATLLLTAGGAAGPNLADAAILRHIGTALTAPAGVIVHQKAMISLHGAPAQPFELGSPRPRRIRTALSSGDTRGRRRPRGTERRTTRPPSFVR
jgi:hypothetical protein